MPVSKDRMRELQRQRRLRGGPAAVAGEDLRRLRGRTCGGCGRRPAQRYHQAAPELRAWAVCEPCAELLDGQAQGVLTVNGS